MYPWNWRCPLEKGPFQQESSSCPSFFRGYVNVRLCVGKTFSPLLVCLLKGAYGITKCYRYFVQNNGRFRKIHLEWGTTPGWTKEHACPRGPTGYHASWYSWHVWRVGEDSWSASGLWTPLKKHRFRRCFPFMRGGCCTGFLVKKKHNKHCKQEIWVSQENSPHHGFIPEVSCKFLSSFPWNKVPFGSFWEKSWKFLDLPSLKLQPIAPKNMGR